MKITITCEEADLILTNDELNNFNFVELDIIKKDGSASNYEPIMVSMDELMPAVIAFDAQRSRNKEDDV